MHASTQRLALLRRSTTRSLLHHASQQHLRLLSSATAVSASSAASWEPQKRWKSTRVSVDHDDEGPVQHGNLLERAADAADEEKTVWRHRPQRYTSISFRDMDKQHWKHMDRTKFRLLLEDCMAKGTVTSMLRRYLDEFPIMDIRWSDQELVLITGALIKSNRDKLALDVLQNQITEANLNRLNRVAAESARLGNARVAIGVLDIAKHFQMAPDVITYTSAIHACARGPTDDITQAFELLDEMLVANVQPNHRTYGAVVLAYARMNQWDDIDALMDSIPYDKEVLPMSEVYTAAIISCTRNRQFVYATRLFQKLMNQDLYLGEKVTNAALSACARTSDLETLQDILAFTEKHAMPSIYTYNTMISAYGHARQMESALNVFDRMQENNVKPDLVTYNALLLAACRSRQDDVVDEILNRMQDQKVRWDVYTLNSLLEICQQTGDTTRAKGFWERAKKEQRLRLDRANYETLLGVHYEAGEYETVINIWKNSMPCRRRAKSAKTLNFLIRSCAKLGEVETATSLLEEFAQRGQIATAIAHNHLLTAYLTSDDWLGAKKQLQAMQTDPKLSTTLGFTSLMKHALKSEQYGRVLDIYEWYQDQLVAFQNSWCPQLRFPADAVYVYAARAAAELDDHERLIHLYQSLPSPATSASVRAEIARLVLKSCEKHEDWRHAVSLYDEVSKIVDEDTNVEFYEIVVKVVARAGEFESALDVNGGEWYRQNRPDQGWF
ncbi:hypothetical protein Poli38472_000373 [Pythium oligandrum]|uniref:Pentacotripeptide-repeat region of PRORP domain-containing protein n=1 Tax=Pythium oligandrum TaxID=41045 RepID=A0A8K1FF99_PYTOL|nr:hypothetical protein Poli38472_000373 [Pythium oligandrum]|eukprot:TMW60331.1 hypothetical protein Poli38472_000373 [Pythium oligandrum]